MAKILVVEDYPPMASMLMRMLRTRGYQVTRELSVSGAMAHQNAFDCAVLDIDLPDGNGVALAEHLLSQHRVNQVVFFTATREASTLSRAAEMGAVVDKVQGVDKLLAAVARLNPLAMLVSQATAPVADATGLFCIGDGVGSQLDGRPQPS